MHGLAGSESLPMGSGRSDGMSVTVTKSLTLVIDSPDYVIEFFLPFQMPHKRAKRSVREKEQAER
jgi:hypothetical protein